MKDPSLYVEDTVLYVRAKTAVGYLHRVTKDRARLTDGVQHRVTVKKVTPEEMEKLWK